MDPAKTQFHNNQSRISNIFRDYIPEELIEKPNYFLNRLSGIVAATEGSIPFSAARPMGRILIVGSRQPFPCSDSNGNDITIITNATSIENPGFVDGSTIPEDAMSVGGQ